MEAELPKDLLATQSSVDDAWDALSDYQKIQLMTRHTKQFNLTNDELNTMLLRLPFTEQEINAAYAVNNGGGVIFKTTKFKTKEVKTKARIDRFLEDGTAEIITLVLRHSGIEAHYKVVDIENYVVDTYNAVDADILTRYTIYKARCEELGYQVDIAKEQLVKDFNETSKEHKEKYDKIGEPIEYLDFAILRAYVNGFAITDIASQLINKESDVVLYEGDIEETDEYLSVCGKWADMRDGIAETLLVNTGIYVITWGYDVLQVGNVKTFKKWMAVNFEKKDIAYSAGKENNIKICGKWMDLDDYPFKKLSKQINMLIKPCGYKIDIIIYEADHSRMWAKLKNL